MNIRSGRDHNSFYPEKEMFFVFFIGRLKVKLGTVNLLMIEESNVELFFVEQVTLLLLQNINKFNIPRSIRSVKVRNGKHVHWCHFHYSVTSPIVTRTTVRHQGTRIRLEGIMANAANRAVKSAGEKTCSGRYPLRD